MRKKRSSNTEATPHGEPPARWMAPGSDPGIGKLRVLPGKVTDECLFLPITFQDQKGNAEISCQEKQMMCSFPAHYGGLVMVAPTIKAEAILVIGTPAQTIEISNIAYLPKDSNKMSASAYTEVDICLVEWQKEPEIYVPVLVQ
ncbi:hypothetical protein QQP08_027448 [Theobroma cacao]|nr:hypothetical protein QQP08_027448 [Theobroma cacao]